MFCIMYVFNISLSYKKINYTKLETSRLVVDYLGIKVVCFHYHVVNE